MSDNANKNQICLYICEVATKISQRERRVRGCRTDLTKLSCTALVLCGLLAGCASGPPKKTEDLCAVFSQKAGWQGAALKQQKKWGTPMFPALAIMKQESAFRSEAQPPRKYYLGFIPGPRPSSAYGYSQALKGTWKFYKKDTGEYWRKRNDFVDALDFINWYMKKTTSENGIAATDTYSQYLNYHEGWAGYRKGSYKKKEWLPVVARKVAKQADRYAAQYGECPKPRRGLFNWW